MANEVASGLKAQENRFAFTRVSGGNPYAPAPVTNYKYDVAKQVFDDLVRARGDRYKAVPKFIMNSGRQYMAWMNPVEVEIGLEEKIYDVCTSFGSDSLAALATLLAHELTHYYENHDWSRSFINHNEDLKTSDEIASLPEGIKFETQADYLGGILAIAAGYDTYELMPTLLQKAYDTYGLPEQVPGYPSLPDRIRISENTAGELKNIHAIYQTANLLTWVDAYSPALTYYEKVLNTYQGYEVYNNAGSCALLAYLQLLKPGEMPYALPLELEASSRLDKLATRLPDDPEKVKEMLLQKARNYLINAANLTEKEPTAALNMAIYHLLSKEYFDADYWATKAQRLAIRYRKPRTNGDAQIVLGVLAALDDRPEEAQQLFTMASAKSRQLSEINLAVLNGAGRGGASRGTNKGTPEKIGPSTPENLLFDLPQLDVNVEVNKSIYCGKKAYADHNLLLHFADDGEAYALFQRTSAASLQTREGIRLGADYDAVVKAYGLPDKNLSLSDGYCLRYDGANIIFTFNNMDRLIHWTVFHTNLELP